MSLLFFLILQSGITHSVNRLHVDTIIVSDQNLVNQVEVELTGVFRGNYGASSHIKIVDIEPEVDAE